MANLIWQAAIGEEFKNRNYVKTGIRRAKEWADRIGADYYLYEGENRYPGLTSVKMHSFDEEFDKWDKVLVLDVDMIPTDAAPNIFDTMEDGQQITAMSSNGAASNGPIHRRPSGGSIMYTREVRQKFREVWDKYSHQLAGHHCDDENFIRLVCDGEGIPIYGRKDQRWDWFPPRRGVSMDAYLVHFAAGAWQDHYNEDNWK